MERRGRAWMRWGWAVAAVLVAGAAGAGSGPTANAVRKQAESSLLVEGQVDIEQDGSVSAVTLEHEDKLPEGVRKYVRDSATQWKFEPVVVGGKVVRARAPMSARLVARKIDGDSYQISIRSASFRKYEPNDRGSVGSIEMKPPSYPEAAYRFGVNGTVYLVIKVGRDGAVEDAFAEQVNLRVYAPEQQMRHFREVLANSALAAARGWKFRPPTEGEQVKSASWAVRVPINYSLERGTPRKSYGRWETYIPGPREHVPWADDEDRACFSPDALADGGVYMAGNETGPKLLTPLQGG